MEFQEMQRTPANIFWTEWEEVEMNSSKDQNREIRTNSVKKDQGTAVKVGRAIKALHMPLLVSTKTIQLKATATEGPAMRDLEEIPTKEIFSESSSNLWSKYRCILDRNKAKFPKIIKNNLKLSTKCLFIKIQLLWITTIATWVRAERAKRV